MSGPTRGHTRPLATRYRPAPLVPGSLAWARARAMARGVLAPYVAAFAEMDRIAAAAIRGTLKVRD